MLINLDQLFRRRVILPAGILHLGAHYGQERLVYNRYCRGPIVLVEALPDVFAKLRANVSGYPRMLPLCACVSDVDGQDVTFHVADNEGMSSSMLEFGTHSTEHPDVHFTHDVTLKTIRVDSLLKAHGVEMPERSFLNVDVQGAELMVLRGMGDLLNRFWFAHMEINKAELYKNCARVEEIDAYLGGFGLKRIETCWTKHNWGDGYYFKDENRKQ